MKTLMFTALAATMVSLAACASEDGDGLTGKPGGYDNGQGGTNGDGTGTGDGTTPGGEDGTATSPAAQCTDLNRKYAGLGGEELTATRVDEFAGLNRNRVKPFSALDGEYTRVLGKTPTLLASSAASFGEAPARWSSEPQGSALTTYQSYRIAFGGCLELTGEGGADAAKYANAPDATTAGTICAEWERKFWSRTPEAGEIEACKQVAVTDSAKELPIGAAPGSALQDTAPRRRWAYTCAAVLTAAGFSTY